jgi:hypothetical protein
MTKFRLAGTVAAIAVMAAVATTAVVAQQSRSGKDASAQTRPGNIAETSDAPGGPRTAAGHGHGFGFFAASDDLTAVLDIVDDEPRERGARAEELTGQGGSMPGEWRGHRRWRDDDEDRPGARRMPGPPGQAGMMRGMPGRLGLCGPRGEGMAERMLTRLERVTRPTEAQRASFEKLKEAAGKASEIARAGCPAEPSLTPTGRLANAEKRLEAMLQAVRTLRPPFEEFFGSLTDEQKARLYAATSRRPGPWMRGGRGQRDGWRGPHRERERFGERRRWRSGRDDNGWPGQWRGRS